MKASLNHYRLEHLNLLIEQARAKGGRIACLGLDETEKYNSYANYVYPNNKHMHLNSRDALLAIQCKPVDGFFISIFLMCPSTMQYVPKVLYTPKRNGN